MCSLDKDKEKASEELAKRLKELKVRQKRREQNNMKLFFDGMNKMFKAFLEGFKKGVEKGKKQDKDKLDEIDRLYL